MWCLSAAEQSHLLLFIVLGDAKGLLSAAIRTSCLLVPVVFTVLTAESLAPRGVRLLVDLGVRPGVMVVRAAYRFGVCDVPMQSHSSPSDVLPGVMTRHSWRDCLLLWNLWLEDKNIYILNTCLTWITTTNDWMNLHSDSNKTKHTW